jgi:sortase A
MRKLFVILPLLVITGAGAATYWKLSEPLLSLPYARIAAPIPPPIAWYRPVAAPQFHRGERIGEIEVPRLKLSVPVYEGDDAGILDLGAGHVPGTALPGTDGNICIAAHRDKFFRALRFIKPHDEVVLATKRGIERFTVDATTIVKPTDTAALMPAPHRDLTLVTCYPFFYVGSAPKRFIVHAEKVG